jgi:hypothetical protein|nr:MAG TPA: BppU domain protein [Caudoviricetes sp.]
MIYIKLDDDKTLSITVNGKIYRGDNLNQKITFLMPKTVDEVDMLEATPYLCYIRADGVADIVALDRLGDTYKDAFYQYVLPVSCRLSKFPGEVCAWLQIFSGTPSNPTIAKSGECLLYVEESKNMDDYICDHQLSAIYALQKQTETAEDSMETMRTEMEKKGDSLVYDVEKKILQMSSNGKPVGDAVDMSEMVNDDETIHFGEDESDPPADADAVIYFG